uniref:Microtubule-associated protein n=1 Tax=Schistocephalus solidus TaxID=70667 RepID=A0A0X3PA02_SCHSO
MATSTTPAGSDSLSTKMAHLQLSSLNPVPPTQSQLSPNGDAVVVTAAASPGGSSSACSRAQPSAAPLRSGIPRYAIPYRRPDRLPCGPTASGEYSNGHTVATSSTTGPQSEASLTSPPSISPGYGGGGGGGVGRSGGSVGAYDNISDAGSVGGQGPYGLTGLRNGRLLSQRTDLRESTRASSVRARGRYDRAMSEDFLGGGCGSGGGVGDTESEHSSAFSSSGQPRRITAKVNSLANASYKPGGGNVKILDRKLDFSNAKSKCNSKANIHYKPGGGDICIMDEKLNFKEASKPKVNSLQNAKHAPRGGDVKIDTQKFDFRDTAKPKIESLKNAQHHPGGGGVQIFSEKLPWLKYNKPNLPREELEKINKHAS